MIEIIIIETYYSNKNKYYDRNNNRKLLFDMKIQ